MNAYREIICKCDSNHFFLAGRDNHLYPMTLAQSLSFKRVHPISA